MSPNRPTISPAKPHRILLVGASGQLGWELRQALQPLGPVLVATRRPTPGASGSPGLTIDLSDSDSIRSVVRAAQPTLIVNAAAYTAVDRAEQEPQQAMAINATAVGVLAEEAVRCNAAIVHFSTDYVFDGSGKKPWSEDDRPAPLNVYAQSKLAGELALTAVGPAHLILRICWVYGLHGNNFVKTMLRLAAVGPQLSVVADQFGAPTSARVIADATSHILRLASVDVCGLLRERGGIYHLCCAGETSWHGFAGEIFRLAQAFNPKFVSPQLEAIPTNGYPTPALRPLNSRLDTRRVCDVFGLTLPAWQEALRPCLETLILGDAAGCMPGSGASPQNTHSTPTESPRREALALEAGRTHR